MKINNYIFITVFFLIFNLVMPSKVLSEGPPPAKEWKGEGTKIEFPSMPTMTIKNFLNGVVPEKTLTIWGTLKFPANAADKNVSAVVMLHGGGGIHEWEEHWAEVFNTKGIATFIVDSNWPRRNCKKKFKKTF